MSYVRKLDSKQLCSLKIDIHRTFRHLVVTLIEPVEDKRDFATLMKILKYHIEKQQKTKWNFRHTTFYTFIDDVTILRHQTPLTITLHALAAEIVTSFGRRH